VLAKPPVVPIALFEYFSTIVDYVVPDLPRDISAPSLLLALVYARRVNQQPVMYFAISGLVVETSEFKLFSSRVYLWDG
jgi:hypothetical protein